MAITIKNKLKRRDYYSFLLEFMMLGVYNRQTNI